MTGRRLLFLLRRLLLAVPLLLGVSLIGFTLLVWLAPDQTYALAGRGAGADQLAELRHSLGYDRPFWLRYLEFLREMGTLQFGFSDSSGERVGELLLRAAGHTALACLPGFFIGHALALLGALLCARHAHSPVDRLISSVAALATSLSLVAVVIGAQALLSSSAGLDWLPVRGWDISSPLGYLRHAAVPTVALALTALAYNLRFYRGLLVAQRGEAYVAHARAYGEAEGSILRRQILPVVAPVIATRVLFSVPLLLVSGSLIVENHFGIPGLGRAAYEAMTSGDQPVLKAVVTLGAALFALALALSDAFQRYADPRLELQ
jgi:peptide/nickel transport system permease protein